MRLIYLYIEKYKNIINQGFNFSSQSICDYRNKTLTIDENEDYIENFFGNNINISAIIGENGSGKSAILEAILKISEGKFSENYILIGGFKFKAQHLKVE